MIIYSIIKYSSYLFVVKNVSTISIIFIIIYIVLHCKINS